MRIADVGVHLGELEAIGVGKQLGVELGVDHEQRVGGFSWPRDALRGIGAFRAFGTEPLACSSLTTRPGAARAAGGRATPRSCAPSGSGVPERERAEMPGRP